MYVSYKNIHASSFNTPNCEARMFPRNMHLSLFSTYISQEHTYPELWGAYVSQETYIPIIELFWKYLLLFMTPIVPFAFPKKITNRLGFPWSIFPLCLPQSCCFCNCTIGKSVVLLITSILFLYLLRSCFFVFLKSLAEPVVLWICPQGLRQTRTVCIHAYVYGIKCWECMQSSMWHGQWWGGVTLKSQEGLPGSGPLTWRIVYMSSRDVGIGCETRSTSLPPPRPLFDVGFLVWKRCGICINDKWNSADEASLCETHPGVFPSWFQCKMHRDVVYAPTCIHSDIHLYVRACVRTYIGGLSLLPMHFFKKQHGRV